jgi:hypothetical protein
MLHPEDKETPFYQRLVYLHHCFINIVLFCSKILHAKAQQPARKQENRPHASVCKKFLTAALTSGKYW